MNIVAADPPDADVLEDPNRPPPTVEVPRRQKLTKPGEIPNNKPGEIPRVSRQGGVVVVNPWAKP
jgi:hypothetical protein